MFCFKVTLYICVFEIIKSVGTQQHGKDAGEIIDTYGKWSPQKLGQGTTENIDGGGGEGRVKKGKFWTSHEEEQTWLWLQNC